MPPAPPLVSNETRHDFGEQAAGTAVTAPIVLQNSSGAPFDLRGDGKLGSGSFAVDASPCAHVDAGSNCTVKVTFTPIKPTAYTWSFRLIGQNGSASTPIVLLGKGLLNDLSASHGTGSQKSAFGFTQEFDATVTSVVDFYQSRNFPVSDADAPARRPANQGDCPGGSFTRQSIVGDGHGWRIAIQNGKIFMHDEFDNSPGDSTTGEIAPDGTFHLSRGGYRFDGKIQIAPGVTLPVPNAPAHNIYDAPVPDPPTVATGRGVFEQSWSVVAQPCYPVWVVDFKLTPIRGDAAYTILPSR